MRVGMIGLGRTGEGMARRMLAKGIEVWGYSAAWYFAIPRGFGNGRSC